MEVWIHPRKRCSELQNYTAAVTYLQFEIQVCFSTVSYLLSTLAIPQSALPAAAKLSVI